VEIFSTKAKQQRGKSREALEGGKKKKFAYPSGHRGIEERPRTKMKIHKLYSLGEKPANTFVKTLWGEGG